MPIFCSFPKLRIFIFACLVTLAAACAANAPPTATPVPTSVEITLVDPEAIPTSTIQDPVLRAGEADYQKYCAHCHSYEGQGQAVSAPGDTERLGMRVVPPLDATGNAWRYADQLLLLLVRNGVQNPLDHYPMPPWGGVLTDEQIMGVLSYIKLWWTEEQRQHQADVTANLARARQALTLETTLTPEVTPQ